ncbi:magnesium/cobalt transporter CorA [Amnimonas aquatica]|uniref:Magnesium transport protein CorA n=1 Tax=Amnimonas aquatica TaxID=2094561 RepID=A0A2P6AQK2_9GAMM|nr:magnesium/cobalt transporter CorA [Amnimonas aquatica]PQA31115.1 magnesium and cobalt transport protein CorA [Amnimonas aquatica]
MPDSAAIINSVAYDRSGKRIARVEPEQAREFLAANPEAFLWLGLHEPDADMLALLQSQFDLHELAIEDALCAHQRPKIEAYGDTRFIVVHTAEREGNRIVFGETHLFLGPNFLITIRHGPSHTYASMRQRVEARPKQLSHGPSYPLYAVIDFIVDNYVPIVEDFKQTLQQLESDIFLPQYKRGTIKRLYQLKRELITLRLASSPLQDIAQELSHGMDKLVHKSTQPYFRDIADHCTRINEAIDALNELLTAAIQVNLSLVTVKQNEVVKKLAGWAALLALPTLVTSIYGMNFVHMPELQWQYGYPLVLGLTALACLRLHKTLKRAGWM